MRREKFWACGEIVLRLAGDVSTELDGHALTLVTVNKSPVLRFTERSDPSRISEPSHRNVWNALQQFSKRYTFKTVHLQQSGLETRMRSNYTNKDTSQMPGPSMRGARKWCKIDGLRMF